MPHRSVHISLYDLGHAGFVLFLEIVVIAPILARCYHNVPVLSIVLRELDQIFVNMIMSGACLLTITHRRRLAIAVADR